MSKVLAIICEYNPFHNGHAYHIQKTKEKTGAQYIIALMSGNFVQRGAPAIMEKQLRTQMALTCGADLVIELPLWAACASAPYFAAGSIAGRSVEQLDTDRTECISVANKYRRGDVLTSDEMALLGEGMVKGWVRIVASMSLENTNVQFTSEALPTSNSANMVLTYSRR